MNTNGSIDPKAIVSLHSASFGYADNAVVSGITLDIHAGEIVAILGPNGSGKSTLVKGLLGLNDHLGGQVALFGTPVEHFRQHARLGYVPQRHTLSASVRATATEIVAIGRLPHQGLLGRASRQDRQIITECLDVVGLGDRADVDVNTLSGGQQRRVLIARALAAQPDVLIMDEPTAGVDLASQEVLSLVLARLAERGTTMLIVTHELQAIHGVLTRVLQMDAGHVVFDGTPEQSALSHSASRNGQHGHHHDDDDEHAQVRRSSTGAGPLDQVHDTYDTHGKRGIRTDHGRSGSHQRSGSDGGSAGDGGHGA
jgi:zinc transport system ATP-binding protein